ncbi:MAG: glutamine synthetase beta-grasp domain-containing protein [Synergistaceae bacterium]|nr:glutamine synthetase beta-grasp domain-containing protein [Synergistaceae bacterium]
MFLSKYDGYLKSADFLNLLMIDISGNIRVVTLPKGYVSEKILMDGIGFDASNYGYAKVSNSDMVAIPDMSTAFIEERGDFRNVHVFCDVVSADDNRSMFAHYPRNITRAACDYLRSCSVADDVKMLVEIEFYVFDSVQYSTDYNHSCYSVESREGLGDSNNTEPRFGLLKGYHRLSPQDKYRDFRDRSVSLMEAVGIPVKYHHHEVAASQLEVELDFLSIVEAGDKVCLAKWILRSVAEEMGLSVTFMPKPLNNMSGSSVHVHQFLEKDGKSIFPGDEMFNLSKEALSYTSGLLEHSLTGSLLAFTNPSTNSYRRLVPGFEAPISANFARGSRCAAVRIPSYVKKDATRIEYRTGDATANIYYMLSAMVMAGVDGIMRSADPIAQGFNSPEILEDKIFPLNLNTVLDRLSEDNAYLAPVFPKELIDLWIKIKREEAQYVYNAPTPQEYELYF